MNLNYYIKSIFILICISLVKSQYFYHDDYYQDNLDSNDTLAELEPLDLGIEPIDYLRNNDFYDQFYHDDYYQDNLDSNDTLAELEPLDPGIEPIDYLRNNDFYDQPQASVSEHIMPTHTQNQQASGKLATEAQINLMPETTSQDKHEKVVQEFFDQLSTPLNDKKENESKSNIKVEYIDYDYEEFMNDYYESTPEDDVSSKETILEKVIDKQAEEVYEPPRGKKSFNLLYIFVPVATIAALVLVIAVAVIFRRIAIKKQNSTSNKNVIYRQVATSETPKV